MLGKIHRLGYSPRVRPAHQSLLLEGVETETGTSAVSNCCGKQRGLSGVGHTCEVVEKTGLGNRMKVILLACSIYMGGKLSKGLVGDLLPQTLSFINVLLRVHPWR